MSDVATVEIWDPTLKISDAVAPALRPSSLDGKVLGLLDNTKEKAAIFLTTLADGIGKRYDLARVVQRRKASYSRTAADEIIAELSESCDAVITAMGA
ncbi:hypothetical protein C2W62_01745 [Candidatus Entotheonella serta]|nr:hypothetical protein C2W62_01745 [Candidatus Entotheonella serta]